MVATVAMVSFNVVSPDAHAFFNGSTSRCVHRHHAGSLTELRDVLHRHTEQLTAPTVLDLIGHSTSGHHLLRLGDTTIDMLDPYVCRFFRDLYHADPIRRTIVAVRLLGCQTGVTDAGLRTLRLLAWALRIPVYGTRRPLLKSHYNADGFDPAFARILIQARPSRS